MTKNYMDPAGHRNSRSLEADRTSLFYARRSTSEPAQRKQFIAESCASDAALRAELESLVRSSRRWMSWKQTLGFARRRARMPGQETACHSQPAGLRVGAYRIVCLPGPEAWARFTSHPCCAAYEPQVAIKRCTRVPGYVARAFGRFDQGRWPHPGQSQSSQYRSPSRRWHDRRRSSISGDGVCERNSTSTIIAVRTIFLSTTGSSFSAQFAPPWTTRIGTWSFIATLNLPTSW